MCQQLFHFTTGGQFDPWAHIYYVSDRGLASCSYDYSPEDRKCNTADFFFYTLINLMNSAPGDFFPSCWLQFIPLSTTFDPNIQMSFWISCMLCFRLAYKMNTKSWEELFTVHVHKRYSPKRSAAGWCDEAESLLQPQSRWLFYNSMLHGFYISSWIQ